MSVLIATYNRAEILRQTLNSMTRLDREGLLVEFVVIDNNSTDHTKQVVAAFNDSLPIRYLFEPRAGKNCALNKALEEVKLGKIVIFTDDDVVPCCDWLQKIVEISLRWQDYSVFGGKSYPVWPTRQIPSWAQTEWIQCSCFGLHDFSQEETPYSPRSWPFGVNYWVRSEVFAHGRRFEEAIGPRPGQDFVMGSEASFFRQLIDDGYGIIYSPDAVVGHHVQPPMLSRQYIRRRGYRLGRGRARWTVSRENKLVNKYPTFQLLLCIAGMLKALALYTRALISMSIDRRVEREFCAVQRFAYRLECLRLIVRGGQKLVEF